MRRFEFVEGASKKFWEIALRGAEFDVCWGRIGTSGQSQTKSFASDSKALAEHDKLIKEKTGKGYVEVGAHASAAPVAAPVPAAPVASKPKAAAKKEEAPEPAAQKVEATPKTEPVAKASSSTWVDTFVPTDPRTWPAAMRAELHPFRGFHVEPLNIDKAKLWRDVGARFQENATGKTATDSLRARMEGEFPASPLSPAQEALVALRVSLKEPVWTHVKSVIEGFVSMIDLWVLTGGCAHAVRSLRALCAEKNQAIAYAFPATVSRLAHHLALVDEAEHRAAEEAAELHALPPHAHENPLRAGLIFLFAERGLADAEVIAAASSATPGSYAYLHPLVVASITMLAALEAGTKVINGYMLKTAENGWRSASADATLLSFVARFGEPVLGALEAFLKRSDMDSEALRSVTAAIALVGSERAFALLAAHADERAVLTALRDRAIERPLIALAPLVHQSLQRGAASSPCRTILSQVIRADAPGLQGAIEQLGDAGNKLIAELRAKSGEGLEDAAPSELPSFVVTPFWLGRKLRGTTQVDGLAKLPFEDVMAWPEGLQAKWKKQPAGSWADVSRPDHFMRTWGIPSETAKRLSETDDPGDEAEIRKSGKDGYFYGHARLLPGYPPRFACKLLKAFAEGRWWGVEAPFHQLAATNELAFLDAFLAFAASHTEEGLDVLLPYRSPRVAMLAADVQYRLKKKPPAAKAWLLRHPEAAAVGLIPKAIGKSGKERDAAEYALRWLAKEGHEGVVMEVAARYGEAAKTATRAVLDFDPLHVFPTKLPTLPDFAKAETLPRLVLRESGHALPVSAMQHVLTMLAFSKPGEPYAGIAILKELVTASSQGEFAWELFQSWQVAGADSKQGWAFAAMGFFGDDACARRLTPLLRAWPGEAQHQRAVAGLEVLASIGTDVALMHLHGIAQKLKFKGLQDKAREKIDQIAEARGLTADELADRLVPDLGLDEDGSLTLDFGPRSFRVVFDESLKPFAKEESGKRLPDLPKPRKDDDEAKSKEATETWKALKKDSKTIAQQQVTRLELAMCGRRRWTVDVFRPFLVEHPLMRHLVQRIVWGTYDAEGKLTSLFRVAEDGSYADASDEVFALPEGASIGVAHTLEMQRDDEAKFAQSFADYELLQPFKQFGRETFALTPEEAALPSLSRWTGTKIPTGKVLGLEARGWRRGSPQDGGHIAWMEKPLSDTQVFTLELDPGISVGMLDMYPEQELHGLGIGMDWRWRKEAEALLGALDPIVMSEALRDVELLVR